MKDKLLCVLRSNILECDVNYNSVWLEGGNGIELSNHIHARRITDEEQVEKVIKKGNWFRKPVVHVEYNVKNVSYHIYYAGQKYPIDKLEFEGLINLYYEKLKENQEKELDKLCK